MSFPAVDPGPRVQPGVALHKGMRAWPLRFDNTGLRFPRAQRSPGLCLPGTNAGAGSERPLRDRAAIADLARGRVLRGRSGGDCRIRNCVAGRRVRALPTLMGAGPASREVLGWMARRFPSGESSPTLSGMAISDKRKQSLYFPEEMLKEIAAEATRQDRSLSWIVQKAWKAARKDLMKIPSVEGFPRGQDEDAAPK